jgi:hypothetical protein
MADQEFSTEYDPQGMGREPQARTPRGNAFQAAKAYAEKGNGEELGEVTPQDPYPFDPTNALLDGDGHPSADMIAAKGLRVTDSGRALVRADDPSGYELIPPPHSNMEVDKALEKIASARDVSAGVDPVEGRKARAQARNAAAAKTRKAAARESTDGEQAARSEPPKGRATTPTKSTTSTK